MDQADNQAFEGNNETESTEINNIRNSAYQNLLMILGIVSATLTYGCIPKLTKYQKTVRDEIYSRCSYCLMEMDRQELEQYICMQNQVLSAIDGKKHSMKKCNAKKGEYEMHDCENLCEDVDIKCRLKALKALHDENRVLKKIYLCVINLIKKKKKFDKSMSKTCQHKYKLKKYKTKPECKKKLKRRKCH